MLPPTNRATTNSVPASCAPSTRARRSGRAFSLVELLVALSIVAVLLSLLLPLLRHVRYSANTTICAMNLRQIGMGWRQYLDDYQQFPYRQTEADWKYGGATFIGQERRPVLASDRPVNAYVMADTPAEGDRLATLFRSPLDRGFVWAEAVGRPRAGSQVFPEPTAFERFGTSYRANPFLLNARLLDPARDEDTLKEHEVVTMPASLLVVAVPQWQIAADGERRIDASWHPTPDAGNMLAMDGSVRFLHFVEELGNGYDYLPHPVEGPRPKIGTPALPPRASR